MRPKKGPTWAVSLAVETDFNLLGKDSRSLGVVSYCRDFTVPCLGKNQKRLVASKHTLAPQFFFPYLCSPREFESVVGIKR